MRSSTNHCLSSAAQALERGDLVAFPTETVYGLGADAENPAAIGKLYQMKGRPADHPVIVHLPLSADLSYWSDHLPPQAEQLMDAFWPGPLTLIMRRAARIPDIVSGKQSTIGLRCPAHPTAQALLQEFKQGRGGIAAPSANRFKQISPTTTQHVQEEFADAQGRCPFMILAGEQSEIGIESTIVDVTRIPTHGVVVLRPGHIRLEQLSAVLGRQVFLAQTLDTNTPRASGLLSSHYAPKTPLWLVKTADLPSQLTALRCAHKKVALMLLSKRSVRYYDRTHVIATRLMPIDARQYAYDLYRALRVLDQSGAEVILLEPPPNTPAWQAVLDRLTRAQSVPNGIIPISRHKNIARLNN